MFERQYQQLWKNIEQTKVAAQLPVLKVITEQVIANINSGDLPKWLAAFNDLPEASETKVDWEQEAVTVQGKVSDPSLLLSSLQTLIPWRKGPFQLFDTYIDTEWQSNMKWKRLKSHLPDLSYKTVLDVGCGNGYYLMKMAEQNASLLLGIEPGLLQNVQFWAVNQYAKTQVVLLPLKMEHLPMNMACFDVVLSMGVLYHRKSPIDHLEHLKKSLAPGGTLIMETIVIDGDEQTCLIPQDRYAQMRNVWFLPSVDMLCLWMKRIGLKNIEVVDVSTTTVEEQRGTDWMLFHSLPEFMCKETGKTIEGYDAPKRAIIKANI